MSLSGRWSYAAAGVPDDCRGDLEANKDLRAAQGVKRAACLGLRLDVGHLHEQRECMHNGRQQVAETEHGSVALKSHSFLSLTACSDSPLTSRCAACKIAPRLAPSVTNVIVLFIVSCASAHTWTLVTKFVERLAPWLAQIRVRC